MLAVVFVLAATLTLLPARALQARPPDQQARAEVGAHRRAPLAEVRRLGRAALEASGRLRPRLPRRAAALAAPVLGLKTAMPSIQVLPEDASARVGYDQVKDAFGDGAPGTLQVVADRADAEAATTSCAPTPGSPAPCPPQPAADGSDLVLIQAVPTVDPSDPELGTTVDRLRADLPGSALVGGAAVENLDLKTQLDDSTPLVIGVVLALGFLLLLVALQAPLISLLGTLASLLSTAAAFGVARLVFQEGIGSGLLGFESQGFLDAWAPVFFFAMIFAIAMDYTVFLLASAKEHYERSGDPHEAMVGSLAHSGRVIFAAGAVMVAVFFTFALSGPLPPKEMGIVLGVAVLLDAFLVRLVLLPGDAAPHRPRGMVEPALADPGAADDHLLARLTPPPFRSTTHPQKRSYPMCRATRCKTCGKTTWAGCGQHVSQVKAGVPAQDWCNGQHTADEKAAAGSGGGFLSRLFGR